MLHYLRFGVRETRGCRQSAMPDKIVGSLSKSELRDLIEFLANLK
jgi:hypothetical protein